MRLSPLVSLAQPPDLINVTWEEKFFKLISFPVVAQARDLIENIRFEKRNFFICAFVLSPLVSLAQPQDLIKTADF